MRQKTEGYFGGDFQKEIERSEIIYRLENGIYCHDPAEFLSSLVLSHHLGMLTVYTVDELSVMYTCKIEGFNVGFAIKDTGEHREIIGVHNNEFNIHNLGQHIVAAAIRAGGNALDHFGSNKLNDLYESMGLFEVSRVPYDAQYDPLGTFRAKYGELPVIYRVLK